MKLTFVFLFIAINGLASDIIPSKGLYFCKNGNEQSICDQVIRPIIKGGKLHALSVEYVGDCGSMGPYQYPCHKNSCGNSGIVFELRGQEEYRWENIQYGIECEFAKR